MLFPHYLEVVRRSFGFVTYKKVINNSLCPPEKGIKLVQEGQYAQAVVLFTEAIKCDPNDYRYVFCDQDYFIIQKYTRVIPLEFNFLPAGFLEIVLIASTAWSSTQKPWQMLKTPLCCLQIGPKDTSAKAALSWA